MLGRRVIIDPARGSKFVDRYDIICIELDNTNDDIIPVIANTIKHRKRCLISCSWVMVVTNTFVIYIPPKETF